MSTDVSTALSTEISNRESAVSGLSTDVSTALSTEISNRASADSSLSTRIDNLSITSVANETSVSKAGDVWTVGLASDVSVASSLTVGGKGTFKNVKNVLDSAISADASVLTAMAATPGDYSGHFFYLKGTHADFEQGNKWYFCEGEGADATWFPSPFYGQ